jgi:hypothetical protein
VSNTILNRPLSQTFRRSWEVVIKYVYCEWKVKCLGNLSWTDIEFNKNIFSGSRAVRCVQMDGLSKHNRFSSGLQTCLRGERAHRVRTVYLFNIAVWIWLGRFFFPEQTTEYCDMVVEMVALSSFPLQWSCPKFRSDLLFCAVVYLFVYLYICGVFSVATSITDYVASNGRMVCEYQIGKVLEGNGRDITWGTTGNWLKGLRKTSGELLDWPVSGPNLNPGPPEHVGGVLPTQSLVVVTVFDWRRIMNERKWRDCLCGNCSERLNCLFRRLRPFVAFEIFQNNVQLCISTSTRVQHSD